MAQVLNADERVLHDVVIRFKRSIGRLLESPKKEVDLLVDDEPIVYTKSECGNFYSHHTLRETFLGMYKHALTDHKYQGMFVCTKLGAEMMASVSNLIVMRSPLMLEHMIAVHLTLNDVMNHPERYHNVWWIGWHVEGDVRHFNVVKITTHDEEHNCVRIIDWQEFEKQMKG